MVRAGCPDILGPIMAPPESDDEASPAQSASARRELWRGADQSSAMGAEFMAAILVWSGIGWLADNWLGTMPWFMGGGALIGNAAGLYLIWLRSSREEHGWGPQAPDRATARQTSDVQTQTGRGGEQSASR